MAHAMDDSSVPTFALLDRTNRWLEAEGLHEHIFVDRNSGFGLEAWPGGPLALDDRHGSLGALVLPRRFAQDRRGTLYLLDLRAPSSVRRFDADSRRFEDVPGVGGNVSGPGKLHKPVNLAVTDDHLYVADLDDDGDGAVKVFHLESCRLVNLLVGGDVDQWEPVDLAQDSGSVLVLDREGRIWRHFPGTGALHAVTLEGGRERTWTRMAVDRSHRLVLLGKREKPADGEKKKKPEVDVFQPSRPGKTRRFTFKESVTDSGVLRGSFDPPMVVLDEQEHFCLAGIRGIPLSAGSPDPPPHPVAPLHHCRFGDPAPERPVVFDRSGRPIQGDTPPGAQPFLYQKKGTWYSPPLDSGIYRCQWHRIELDLADLPAGTWVEVSTHTRDAGDVRGAVVLEAHWDPQPPFRIAGPMQAGASPLERQPRSEEFLVQSLEGRFLYLRIRLGFGRETGSGGAPATPLVNRIRVHYPRASYLQYLPAVYSGDKESRRFLERFLSVFQTEWDDLEERIRNVADHFDPEIVSGKWLEFLAEWMGVSLEGSWEDEKKRRLLEGVPGTMESRGTLKTLKKHIAVYLHNITGLPPEEQLGFPVILEGFRTRRYFTLGVRSFLEPGAGALWSRDMVKRLQLDASCREGEVRLVDRGDPDRDVFHEHAHRFQVYVPSPWVRREADEALLRRAISAESPAHTCHDLCLVEPRFRVGIQSTVGVDTLVGSCPVAYLADRDGKDEPPSRPPRNRLGYDTVLGGAPAAERGIRLNADMRMGIEEKLL